MPYGWHMHDWDSSLGPWFMLIPVLFWLAAFVGIGLLIRALVTNPPRGASKKTALDILSERYAKGEIGRDEYLARKKDIAGD